MKASNPGANKEEILKQKEEIKFNLNIMIGIVARQYTTGIWIQSSKPYI